MDPKNALPDFDGDNRDQRSWTIWMVEWLSDARKACKPGAPICLFIDWRQYPSITDALQWAGWIWRGSVVWDKDHASEDSVLHTLENIFRTKSGIDFLRSIWNLPA